jgi:excinuclease ABC subunit C
VHRFGINFHRQKRSKGTFKNSLQDIKGIGSGTANILLKTFRSINNIKQQSEEELAKIIGNSKAKLVKNYFNSEEGTAP